MLKNNTVSPKIIIQRIHTVVFVEESTLMRIVIIMTEGMGTRSSSSLTASETDSMIAFIPHMAQTMPNIGRDSMEIQGLSAMAASMIRTGSNSKRLRQQKREGR
jgi:uncharacterized protein with NRDE domain